MSKTEFCVHKLFEEQVCASPNAIAIVDGENSFSYQELNQRANQIAHFLKKRDVHPGTLVGVCLERSFAMIASILGIIKAAGGTYVPLDPHYPANHLARILSDTKLQHIITTKGTGKHTTFSPKKMLHLNTLKDTYAKRNPDLSIHPVDLAYVIYTSGSSGKPKGVMIEHQSLCHLALSERDIFGITSSSRVLQFTSICFDVSLFEIFSTFFAGASLYLIQNETLCSGPSLLSYLRKQRITLACLPPSLLATLPEENLPDLRVIVTGGELCSRQTLLRWRQGRKFFNAYGPTEATVGTSIAELSQNDNPRCIGKEIPNTFVYLLDTELKPVRQGEPGEIYIGGIGVARGYLNQVSLTQKHFLPDPFSEDKNARMYRTGDFARRLPDNTLEFIGRRDQQVKIRGFRIELSEVEALLSSHPQIKEVVVLQERAKLVAYFVPNSCDSYPSLLSLQQFFASNAPAHLMPSEFVFLKNFPKTPNQKIDRNKLRFLQQNDKIVPPKNPTEEKLLLIWKDILQKEKISTVQNFFLLGGDSLLLNQLLFQVKTCFGQIPDIEDFWKNPTISGMATCLNKYFIEEDSLQVDLNREVLSLRLPDISNYSRRLYQIETNSIFLTGSTGFLGSYLLIELLKRTKAKIYCLILATDKKKAKEKLRRVFFPKKLPWERIKIVPGDLSLPRLGLTVKEFNILSQTIDVIYHNGAFVDLIRPYSLLKPANVLGTKEILSLALQSRTKPLHYISTIGVYTASEFPDKPFEEETKVLHSHHLSGGYTQSKWVAESFLRRASENGVPVTIYRPSSIFGVKPNGELTRDIFYSLLQDCICTLSYPAISLFWNLVPVEFVSQAIVSISQKNETIGQIYHLRSPENTSLSQVLDWVSSFGYFLRKMSFSQWGEEVFTVKKDHNLSTFASFWKFLLPSYTNLPDFLAKNTERILDDSNIKCVPVDRKTFSSYFRKHIVL